MAWDLLVIYMAGTMIQEQIKTINNHIIKLMKFYIYPLQEF
jgi:hypothetical protein